MSWTIRFFHLLIYMEHRGFVFTDDFLFIFQREVAPALATLVVIAGEVLGVRWAYHKLQFGASIDWIGLFWNFEAWSIQIPVAKVEKAVAFL